MIATNCIECNRRMYAPTPVNSRPYPICYTCYQQQLQDRAAAITAVAERNAKR